MPRLLISNGCVIDTRPTVTAHPVTDVLIEDGRIVAVGSGLDAGHGTEVLDATDRIVMPGFVDTHRHGWQSVLRGTAPDVDLAGYLDGVARRFGPALTPADVATAAELTGLECLDAGITTVLDHAHVMFGPTNADAVVAGMRAAGVRAVVGYGQPVFGPRIDAADVRRLRATLADDSALVTMMLAPLGPSYAPADEVLADWRLAAELALPITVHVGAGPVAKQPVATLRELDVLTAGTVYVHGNSLPDDELALIADSGGALSITPAVEARMGHGAPTLPRVRRLGVPAGLGVDVVTTVPGEMFSVMRAALLTADTAGVRVPVADVLGMATAGGAAAVRLADRVGALEPGMAADVVLLRTDTVATAGSHDPLALVVGAHPGLVDAVLVGGRFVKRDGRLLGERAGAVVTAARESARRLAAAH